MELSEISTEVNHGGNAEAGISLKYIALQGKSTWSLKMFISKYWNHVISKLL